MASLPRSATGTHKTLTFDVALAAVDVTAMVFVMNKDGFFHRRHLLAEARRHLALVLRGRRREPSLDGRIVDAAIAAHCLDISEPKTLRGRMPAYLFYTARWSLADPPTRRRSPDAEPEPDPGHRPPVGPGDPGHAPPAPGTGGVGHPARPAPLRPHGHRLHRSHRPAASHAPHRPRPVRRRRGAPAGRDARAAPHPVPGHRRRAPVAARHDGATGPEGIPHGRGTLDLTAERLRHLQDAFTAAADRARTTMDRYADRENTDEPHPVREDDQQAHRPQQSDPHHWPGAGR
ncbi:hypothetical protein ACFWOJ_11545 [Streptomyces sp. NPDC058439]|uniref:hypothetical protein n=1 Tax=Streptomyces sp. NPDC058439 TaxID=3346500 RepID=UPI0036684698